MALQCSINCVKWIKKFHATKLIKDAHCQLIMNYEKIKSDQNKNNFTPDRI